MHWIGLRISSAAQKLTSASAAITLLILGGGVLSFSWQRRANGGSGSRSVGEFRRRAGARAVFPPAISDLAGFIIALRSVIVTYDGWYEAIYFTEEDQNPAKNLPRVLIGGVLLVMGIYLILNLAFLRALGIPALAASTLPAADAARIVFTSWSGKFVTLLSLLTVLSLLNCVLLGTPRILYAIGRDGLFTHKAAEVSTGGTPRAALLISTGAALLLVAWAHLKYSWRSTRCCSWRFTAWLIPRSSCCAGRSRSYGGRSAPGDILGPPRSC